MSGERATSETPDVDRLRTLIDDGDADGAVALARKLHPADLSVLLAGIDGEVCNFLLEQSDAADVAAALLYIEPHYRDDILSELPVPRIAAILGGVPDDVATDIVQALPPAIEERVVAAMPEQERAAIAELIEYPTQTAGGRMTGQRVAVLPHRTVEEVIAQLATVRPDISIPFYVYVVDGQERLLGVLNLRALVTAASTQQVGELAEHDVRSVQADTDQEEAARLLKRHKLLALPVVDHERRLLGTITANDLLDVLEDEATEDMFKLAGVAQQEDLRGVWRSVRFRLPWLSVNLVTVLAVAFAISLFESTVARVVVLAAFLPVIGGHGGNAGIQTLTVVVRSLALGRLTPRNTLRVVGHELWTGLLTGSTIGIAAALVAWGWQGNPWLGMVVGLAILANTIVGVLAGVLIPMGLYRLRQDPALSGGIWVTTVTDLLGILGFLGLAAALISRID